MQAVSSYAYQAVEGSMAALTTLASSNDEVCDCLASFMQDAERSLAALYCHVRETYGERAAHSAAESWLQVLEEQLGGSADFPELRIITVTAIALFVSSVAEPSATSRDSDTAKALSNHSGS